MKNDLTSAFVARQRQKATSNPRLDSRESSIQARFRRDTAALISYLAGRRHGKTEGVAVRIATYARPGAMTAYVAPTITRAHEILVPVLRTLQRDVGLRFELTGSEITFPNGGQVRLMGMSNIAEVQKLRGEDLLAAYFDECGVPKTEVLKTAVLECAWEALRKHRGEPGSGAVMCGTPGPVPGSADKPDFWHEVSALNHDDGAPMYGASRHFGLIYDNPLFAGGKAEASIEEDLKKRIYLSREDSKFRREVLAQWCISNELRCYSHFTGNVWPDSAAPEEGRTIMAVDFGWRDQTAIVVMRMTDYEERIPQEDGSVTITRGERVHVLYAEMRSHWRLDLVAKRVEELQNQYHVGTIVGDQGGGASLQVIESWANMFGVPMIRSQKNAMGMKRSRIHTINDLFAIGHIVFYASAQCLADELLTLVWNDDRDDHHERQPDHGADAFGYGIIETWVPTTVEREASLAEKARDARAAQRRRDLSEPFRRR